MHIDTHNGTDLLYIQGGEVLFREHMGLRVVVAIAPIRALFNGWHKEAMQADAVAGASYYLADHGSYCIADPIVAQAMVDSFNA
jgi:hypothetical protein